MQETTPELVNGVIIAAQSVIDHINQDELARFVAMKNPDESPGAKTRKQKMEAQEAALIIAYSAIAEAIFDRAPKVILRKGPPQREVGFQLRCLLCHIPSYLAIGLRTFECIQPYSF